MTTIQDRFWAKVSKSHDQDCWIWTGATGHNGYGRFGVNGKLHSPHRFSYELSFGSISAKLQIDHKCRNRACVNPDHLQAVTHKQNQENRSRFSTGTATGVRGVSFRKDVNLFVARLTHNKKYIHVGYFKTLPEAESAVISKRRELFTNNIADTEVA